MSLDHPPAIAGSPNLRDSMFLQFLLDMADGKRHFKRCTSHNRKILEWAAEKTDEQLTYWIWLHRGRRAA